MSVNSLPSFAQAFSSHSLSISTSNALPPIRKRDRGDESDSDTSVRVKQEPDTGAPPPSSVVPVSKKRRVTVSGGAPHPLHIDVRAPPDPPSSTPISPVVMGFTVQKDNPGAMEQVRSMISVKQKQKALIEQRRGSAAGIIVEPIAPPTPIEAQPRTAPSRRSPPPSSSSSTTTTRRGNHQRAPSPPPPQHSLPPPPISFAKRRAAVLGGKKKPADIIISPRERERGEFQPSGVQSAPPGQNTFFPARSAFPQMALPRLPSIIGQTEANPRRVAGNVPPTPTRLSMQSAMTNNTKPNRSPPSVPISNTLVPPTPTTLVPTLSHVVPPTPTSLHRPGGAYASADKAAFLAPFSVFYDALHDSKQLKAWLGEQLTRSQGVLDRHEGLMREVREREEAQQERMQETVERMLEQRVEMVVEQRVAGLRRRVDELEEALKSGSAAPNGVYTFPPISSASPSGSRLGVRPELPRRLSSPGWGHPKRDDEAFDARKVSMSASRHDPPPLRSTMQSPSQMLREREASQTQTQTPVLSRQSSRHSAERERDREAPRRTGSRRNSVSMGSQEDDES